jgi:hypothetical protein
MPEICMTIVLLELARPANIHRSYRGDLRSSYKCANGSRGLVLISAMLGLRFVCNRILP